MKRRVEEDGGCDDKMEVTGRKRKRRKGEERSRGVRGYGKKRTGGC